MNAPAKVGHNMPPDPLDEALAPFGDAIEESNNWLDGSPVENEEQMKALDALQKTLKEAKKAVTAAEDSAAKPIYDAWKAEKARFKPTLDDLEMRIKGCAALQDPYKRKLAAEKEEAKRKAYEEQRAKERAAEEAARQVRAGDIEAERAAAEAAQAAMDAKKAAASANKDTVKGMRTVTKYEITDHRKLLNWIAVNRRDDLTAFIEEWARRNHKENVGADGLRVYQEKVAY
ncbi:hypothetical protein Q0601_00745 [Paracoccus onubensis]|uniref:hypothetical protein n=1 Tax=Paracoccus onubensis TaxID=1675788 RepID=UPI00272F72EE|nr:hypothetical protein [Paracoccus onubensis]MDP0925689.1 hypothetical protein [Paracoccus onubensis]